MTGIRFFTVIFLMLCFCGAGLEAEARGQRAKALLKKVSSSVVKVVAEGHKRYVGTGVVLDSEYVVTSLKIVKTGFKRIYIMNTRGEKSEAEVVGKDSLHSISLLKVKDIGLKAPEAVSDVEVGDWAGLVGAFYRDFPSMNQGIVNSVSREKILVNAPVVPGVVGGAVIDRQGRLIGVIRGRFGYRKPSIQYREGGSEIIISESAEPKSLCYVMPAAQLFRVTDILKKKGKLEYGWLGVTFGREKSGIVINSVTDGSPAKKSGLKKNDVITVIQGMPVREIINVGSYIRSFQPGETVDFEILRDKGSKIVKKVELSKYRKPERGNTLFSFKKGDFNIHDRFLSAHPDVNMKVYIYSSTRGFGFDSLELTKELSEIFNVPGKGGLMVSRVRESSSAARSGLKPGDIVFKVNRKPVNSEVEFRRAVAGARPMAELRFDIVRSKKCMNLNITPERAVRNSVELDRIVSRMKLIDSKINSQRKFFNNNKFDRRLVIKQQIRVLNRELAEIEKELKKIDGK